MAGLLDYIRRVAPGDAPVDPMAGSVMSPDYIPQTSPRQLALGGLRGLLDVSPVGALDAAANAINKANVPSLVALRAVMGKQQEPGAAMVGLLGQGGGPGYDAARSAAQAVVPMMGLLGNQASGALPAGYARDQSGAIVWHGSRHKFDQFDSGKIGAGEGAQAYGHGLYFAENPSVAGSYRTAGVSLPAYQESALNALRDKTFGATLDEKVASLRSVGNSQAAEWLAKNHEKAQGMLGTLYKVDLPDEAIAKMLDWDKPLSQQPEAVQKFFSPLIEQRRALAAQPSGPEWGDLAAPYKYDPTGQELMQLLRPAGRMDAAAVLSGGTGGPQSAQRLQDAGIPGVRYFDGGSRNAGAGTSNYVVFPGNEGLLKILERQ